MYGHIFVLRYFYKMFQTENDAFLYSNVSSSEVRPALTVRTLNLICWQLKKVRVWGVHSESYMGGVAIPGSARQ